MRVVFIISILFVVNYVFAQQNDSFSLIEGVVLDSESKEEIPFADISVVNKDGSLTCITQTDFDGSFQVSTDIIFDSLVVDYAGYKSEKVLKGNGDSIFLNTDTIKEVIYTSYYCFRKSCRNNKSEPIEVIKLQETKTIRNPFDEVEKDVCGMIVTIVSESEDLNLGARGYFNEQDIKNMPW